MRRFIIIVVVGCIVTWLIACRVLPVSFRRHPILTMSAMRYMPIGALVLPVGDERDLRGWSKDYDWRSGNPGTVRDYEVVRGFDGRSLLVYQVEVPRHGGTITVHQDWVVRIGY